MAEAEQQQHEQFAMTGSIKRLTSGSANSDPLALALTGDVSAGGNREELAAGQYQIGPYTVTPSDDESGMLEYVVRMQDALMEAVQTLHRKEVRLNELSQQVSQLTVERNGASQKLSALTRSNQEKDERMRTATRAANDWERKYEELEKEDSKKASAEARKQLIAARKQVNTLMSEKKELLKKVKEAEDAKAPLDIKCGALQEELDLNMGRFRSLEEQRQAAQEQVSALTWKLQAFEQQYAALYQQYSSTINRAESPQNTDISRTTLDFQEPPNPSLKPPTPPALTSVDLSHEAEPHSSSEKHPLISESSCAQCESSGSGRSRAVSTSCKC